MQKIKSCGVIVIRTKPQWSFLLMQHPTRYDLPKGHIEVGEDELGCALRELHEETGIEASHLQLDEKFRFILPIKLALSDLVVKSSTNLNLLGFHYSTEELKLWVQDTLGKKTIPAAKTFKIEAC
ncbi:MAG TPA: NUDIX domain-containing protein [Coleofasciculaceae cyanobacterium]|jgi:8-oxo-dGTP pyrophosphatase MutT (NUDIX family)